MQKLENDVGVAQAREASLQQSLDQLKRMMAQTNTADVHLRALERESEADRTMLQSFMNRFEEMSAQLDLNQQSTVRILSRAVGPDRPSWPKKPLVLVVVFLIAITQVSTPIEADLASVTEPISGIVLLFIAAFAPYITYKFLSFVGFDMYHAMSSEQEAKSALNRPVICAFPP